MVDVGSPCNPILRQNSMNTFEMVVSMIHFKAKFLTPEGVGECKGDQQTTGELYLKGK